ncbi:MAG: VWA-like domain-containing protein [Gordonia sp. (in: high G+C Gram-positive bacteria)]
MSAAASAKLTAARLWLISRAPVSRSGDPDAPRGQSYLAQAVFALREVSSDRVARMTVDEGWRLYVNPEWLACVEVPEVGRELCHLVWHLLDQHADRARAAGVHTDSAALWRAATDHAINQFISSAGLTPPSFGRPQRPRRSATTAEQSYTLAVADAAPSDSHTERATDGDENPLDVCGSGADGIPRQHELNDAHDLPAVTRLESDAIRRAVAYSALDADGNGRPGTGIGTEAGHARRWALAVVEPRVPWQQVLAGAVRRAVATTSGRGDYTYQRPSRRTANIPRIVLPSQHRAVPELAVVIDTSGSMSSDLLAQAVTELDAIIAALNIGDRGLTAISVDTAATSMRVRRAADVDLVGGGGTDMSIGLAVAAELRPRPELTVVFTDGYTPWPNAAIPGMTVIAALVGAGPAADLPHTPSWMVRVECVRERS